MQLTQEIADRLKWFHGMNLNGVITQGRVKPEN